MSTWLAARRRIDTDESAVNRQLWRDQTRRQGLRMTPKLRDRLRPRWLRLRQDD